MNEGNFLSVVPREGLHVLHLFYRIDYTGWGLLSAEEKMEARTGLLALIKEIGEMEQTQLLTFSMVTPKSDVGFMLLTKDLQVANALEKRLSQSLGADILNPVSSYFSMTEQSEYTTSEADYAAMIKEQDGLEPGKPGYDEAIATFHERMAKYTQHRLYPVLPDWPVFCFYPMSKRRNDGNNWYMLDFETRKRLMMGHARVGRSYAGRVLQLITGATGLDDHEWGVSLFAHTTSDVKEIIYEMRFDEVTARYGEFGEFLIGLQLPVDEILERLQL